MAEVLIYGNGYLGQKMASVYEGAVLSKTDIGCYHKLKQDFEGIKPGLVINAAGKTGHPNIDWCEINKEATAYSNIAGPLTLARLCKEHDARLVHLSSGCLWDMRTNVSETDVPQPVSFYGVTKAQCDLLLSQYDPEPLIIRLRMPFDSYPHPKNLISKLVGYRRVTGLPNSMTYVPDLLNTVRELVVRKKTGIWNVVNPGPVSHWDILDLFKMHVDPLFHYARISKDELQSFVVAQRTDCTLSSYKLEAEGIRMPPAADRLVEALKGMKEILNGSGR